MARRLFRIPTFLVALMLTYQFVFPIANMKAFASSESILPPSNLAYQSVSPDDGRLTWNAVVGATGYNVYEIKEGQLVLLGSTTTTSYSLNDLPEGTYRYVVSTLSSGGESGPSAPVSAEIVYPSMQAPAKVTSTIRNGNDIVLSWDAASYAQKYNVYQVSQEGEQTLVTSTTGRTYTIAKAAEGIYTYVVSAEHSLYGESAISTPVEVKVAYPVIKEPANLSFTITNGTDVTLKWQTADFATSYNVYQVLDGKLDLKNTVTGTSVKFSNLPPGDYEYKVYSVSDRFGESKEGSGVSLTISSIVMTPPSDLTHKIQNSNDAVLTWSAVPYATGYKVYQVVGGERILKSTLTGTTVTYRMLPAGSYEYEITAYSDRFGESETGAKVSFSIDSVVVNPPQNLSYKIQNGNDLMFTWSAAADADSYKVYQIIYGQKVLKSTVTRTSATIANMAAGDYVFEVHSVSNRFGESKEGARISLTVDPFILGSPENASYEIKNGNDIALKWGAVEYADQYKIYQVIDGLRVLKSTTQSTAVTFANLPAGDYLYEIHANSSRFGESNGGAVIAISLIHPTMDAPANVNQTTNSPTKFTLSWDAVEYAASYKVYQMVDGQKVLKNTVTATSVSFSNMLPGEYHYEIYSYSTRFGESEKGAAIEVIVEDQTLPAPSNFSYSLRNGNDLTLRWDTVPYAANYHIYQVSDGEKVLKRTVTGTTTTASFTNMPAGEFEFVITSYSPQFGESAVGASLTGSIVYPVLSMPENTTSTITNGNDITLRWNAAAYATGYKVYRVIAGERIFQKDVSGLSTSFTNMPEDEYTFEVYAYSDRFGESPEGAQLHLVLKFPGMQAPSNLTQSITNGNDLVLRWTAATYAKEYRVYQVVDGEAVLQKTVTGTSTSFTNLPEGDYQYVVRSYSDRFGESPAGSEIKVSVIWPVVEPPILTGSVFNANNITLSWKSVTWANEYRVYKLTGEKRELIYKGTALSYRVNNLSEDTHTFEVTAYSTRFGESNPSNRLEQVIVYPIMEPPTVELRLLSETSVLLSWDFITYANGYNIYEIVDGKQVLLVQNLNNLSYVLENLSYANHEYVVTSYSNSFGESQPSEIVVAKLIVDTVPAETKINASTQWEKKSQLVKLEAADDETGVAQTFYSVNNGPFMEGTSFLVEQEGVNKVSFYSVDKVGNVEQIKTAYIKIDKSSPVTEISEIPELAKSVAVNLNATDKLSGVAETYYSINGSEYVKGTSFKVEEEGINKLSYYSVDQAGNKEEVKTVEVKIDQTAPTVSVNFQKEYELGSNFLIDYNAVDNLSGIASENVTLNGKPLKKGDQLKLNQPGPYKLIITVTDAAGWTTTVEEEFVVYITANLEVLPKVIKGNSGIFTVKATLPKGFEKFTFDISSVRLNGVSPKLDNNGLRKQAEGGHFKFEREDFDWEKGKVVLELRGYLNNQYLVVAKAIVDVK